MAVNQKELERLRQENIEWLKTVKPGDEICVTNKYSITHYNFGNVIQNDPFDPEAEIPSKEDQSSEICEFTTVRGILSDKYIVVDDNIYTPEGAPSVAKGQYIRTELWKPSDELKGSESRVRFAKTIRSFSFQTWKNFSQEAIDSMTSTITEQVNSINKKISEGKL